MNKLIKISLVAALPALWAAGCSDFLKGGMLTNNPNNATQGSATNNQLFIPIQVNLFAQQNSEVAWSIAQWMQSLFGAARQQVGIYNYISINNGTFDGDWSAVYTGGGLTDIRQLQTQALAAGDNKYYGIALVMEAWFMGNATDWWGDMPYSQAVQYSTYPTPVLDPQQTIYNTVIAKLDTAITSMALAGSGPGSSDLVYGGNTTKWTQLAYTLKARYFLHQAAMNGAAMYDSALANALLGISSNANDYTAWFQTGIQLSSNNWYQFMSANGGTGRAGDMIQQYDSTKIAKILKTTGDPRFAEYFDSTNAAAGFMSNYRLASGYRQPLVTYNENLLIQAEANLHKTVPAAAAALTALNAEQAAWNTTQLWHTARAVAASGVANDSTIMTEKYIALFQNVEVWNDWKRMCWPRLTKVATVAVVGNTIPSRLLDGSTEQSTNPNIPAVGQNPNGAFNWNDKWQGCTVAGHP